MQLLRQYPQVRQVVRGAWLGREFRTIVAMMRFKRLMALCLLISAWRLGQRTAHTALSKAQDIFSQAVCRFDISMATIH